MKAQIENRPNTNLSNGHPQTPISNGSMHSNANITQRKAAVHDLTQSITEECQKLMIECHKSMSKYHINLLFLSNESLNDIVNSDELNTQRSQNYKFLKSALEKLLPQIDQVNFNDNELYRQIQQIIAYLEYTKLEFIRHFYILKSFSMQCENKNGPLNNEAKGKETKVDIEKKKQIDLLEIQSDINEIDRLIHKMSQKYYIFVPDIDDVKTWSKKGETGEKLNSYNLLSKFKFICCFCSPKYI